VAKYQIVETAKQLAGAWYENGVNEWGEHPSKRFYQVWPDVKKFIGMNWPKYLEAARQYHIELLKAPDSAVPPHIKEEIFEDLQAYEERRAKQRPAKVGRGRLTLRPDHPGTWEKKIFWDK